MIGHPFFEHFLKDGLHALPDAGLHVALDVLLEPLIRGQVCLLHSTHNLPDTILAAPTDEIATISSTTAAIIRINAVRLMRYYLLASPLQPT